jgi:hypothetical protein
VGTDRWRSTEPLQTPKRRLGPGSAGPQSEPGSERLPDPRRWSQASAFAVAARIHRVHPIAPNADVKGRRASLFLQRPQVDVRLGPRPRRGPPHNCLGDAPSWALRTFATSLRSNQTGSPVSVSHCSGAAPGMEFARQPVDDLVEPSRAGGVARSHSSRPRGLRARCSAVIMAAFVHA